MQTLYDGLPEEAQAKLLPNKKVVSIQSSADKITAVCADGSTYDGTLLVGADGAHSKVRELMRNAALEASAVPSTLVNEVDPFLTSYRAMWIRFPTVAPIKAGDAGETHGYKCTLQLFAGEDTSVIGIYEKLDKPTRDRVRYSRADEDAFVEEWGHVPIFSGGLIIKDAYTNRSSST